jgi:hypothetical protein
MTVVDLDTIPQQCVCGRDAKIDGSRMMKWVGCADPECKLVEPGRGYTVTDAGRQWNRNCEKVKYGV